jgi:hypothetical protein
MNRTRITYSAIVAILAALAMGVYVQDAGASVGNVSGYAWSDTVGWISLGGADHGLAIAEDGTISGYAWSDNIGWISANASDLTGCPEAPCTAKITSNLMSGWMRALSGDTSQSGDWDGWISLSGSSPDYGVSESISGAFSGFAWGSDVVGWVDFSYATTSAAADRCINIDGLQTTIPSGYTLVDGQCIQQCTAAYSCDGSTVIHTDADCTVTTIAACVAPSYCVDGIAACSVDSIALTVTEHLSARPNIVPSGLPTRIYWSVSNAESCTVSGDNGDTWSGTSSGDAGKLTRPITGTIVYTMVCLAVEGATPTSVTESITVRLLPIFNEN